MLGNFSCFFVICRYFSTLFFSKYSFRNNIRVSNSLDPDQARQSVRPDLDPNCLQFYQQTTNFAASRETVIDRCLLDKGKFAYYPSVWFTEPINLVITQCKLKILISILYRQVTFLINLNIHSLLILRGPFCNSVH